MQISAALLLFFNNSGFRFTAGTLQMQMLLLRVTVHFLLFLAVAEMFHGEKFLCAEINLLGVRDLELYTRLICVSCEIISSNETAKRLLPVFFSSCGMWKTI